MHIRLFFYCGRSTLALKVAAMHQQTASLRWSTNHLSVLRLDSTNAAKDLYIDLHLFGSC